MPIRLKISQIRLKICQFRLKICQIRLKTLSSETSPRLQGAGRGKILSLNKSCCDGGRYLFLRHRDANRFANRGDNILTRARSIPEISRQSLRTYWASSSICDIASAAHFLTLPSSSFVELILRVSWCNFSFVCFT